MISSDSDDSIELAAAVIVLCGTKRKKKQKRSVWVSQWIIENAHRSHHENVTQSWIRSDPDRFRRCLRLDTDSFMELLELVTPYISRSDTNMRQCIPADKRLAITLRYLATGETFLSLSGYYAVGHSTVSQLVPEVCQAISRVLKDQVRCPTSEDEWRAIAQHNFDRWDYPNCIGALDGKHILLDPPPNSGSEYFNYKGTFSIVLMALVDGDTRSIYSDVGTNGRVSDGGVWGKCDLKQRLEHNLMRVPTAVSVPSDPGCVIPFHIVADDAFSLSTTLMKPYAAVELRGNMHRRIYNYRLSRCRNRSENFFGILANRFQVFRSPLRLDPGKATTVVLATVALHNWLRTRTISRALYTPSGFTDWDDLAGGTRRPGLWRDQPQPGGMRVLARQGGNRTANAAREMRNDLCAYFNGAGAREWQDRMIL